MRDTIYRDDAIRVASGYCHPANVAKELEKLPSAEPEPEPVGCSGCRYERFGNRVCDVCSRFYVDRYEAERRTDDSDTVSRPSEQPKQKRDKCDGCTYSGCTLWDKIEQISGKSVCPRDKAGIRKGVRYE